MGPTVFNGTTPVEPWGRADDGYHFSEHIDKAMSWIQGQQYHRLLERQ